VVAVGGRCSSSVDDGRWTDAANKEDAVPCWKEESGRRRRRGRQARDVDAVDSLGGRQNSAHPYMRNAVLGLGQEHCGGAGGRGRMRGTYLPDSFSFSFSTIVPHSTH
jgi:hypothetical protein